MSEHSVIMVSPGVKETCRFTPDTGSSANKRWRKDDDLPVSLNVKSHAVVATSPDEILNRVQEMKFAFGTNHIDHFCRQVQENVHVLLLREKKRLCYRGTSPQLAARKNLVKLMMRIAEAENLTRATLHLAVYLYDRFSDHHDIPVTQLSLAAVTCLITAGKLEEKDTRVPKMKNVRSYLPPSPDFSYKLYTVIERLVVNYFKWSFLVPNAFTFLEFFLLFVVDSTEKVGSELGDGGAVVETNNNAHTTSVHTKCTLELDCISSQNVRSIRSFAIETVDLLLYDQPNDKYPPSLIAAAVMMFARRVHGLHNWSHQLQYVTTYAATETIACCDEYVIKIYERQSKCACFEKISKSHDGNSAR